MLNMKQKAELAATFMQPTTNEAHTPFTKDADGRGSSSALATTTKHQPTVLYIQTNGKILKALTAQQPTE